jgi:hypothetical protein
MNNRQGFLHVSLALVMGIAVVTGFSLWVLLHQWKGLVDTQLRLDKCAGQIALDMKSDLGKLESTNEAILPLRASIATAMATPGAQETVPPLQVALHLIYMAQEVQWVATGGCGLGKDIALPLTPLSWERPPPDALGENQIDLESIPDEFRFEVYHLPRKAAAVVERNEEDENWKAHWTTGTSFN